MSEDLLGLGLWFVVTWPLLLAIPVVNARLSWARHIAIVPAAMLMAIPVDAARDLPWLLFGSGLAINADVRWLLVMAVAIWLAAAEVTKAVSRDVEYHRTTTLFLLTMAGQLGAILAQDVVTFFAFATLMGYAFYGLLVHGGDALARRAARFYLACLIAADLALFEALLLVASTSTNLDFAAVRRAMAGSDLAEVYLGMVLVAFALKAGVWPVHGWLSGAFRAVPRSTVLLLGGVPVATALLGVVRWLPLGDNDFATAGTVMQALGAGAIVYAVFKFFRHRAVSELPAWISVAGIGVVVMALGAGLSMRSLWRAYDYLAHPVIASLGVLLAAMSLILTGRSDVPSRNESGAHRVSASALPPERWAGAAYRWIGDTLLHLQAARRNAWSQALTRFQRFVKSRKAGSVAVTWDIAITLFVLLGLAFAWLAR